MSSSQVIIYCCMLYLLIHLSCVYGQPNQKQTRSSIRQKRFWDRLPAIFKSQPKDLKLEFSSMINYKGIFYNACNQSEPLIFKIQYRLINLCPSTANNSDTKNTLFSASFILAFSSAFASSEQLCYKNNTCTPLRFIQEINKTAFQKSIVQFRSDRQLLLKYPAFNANHNGNLFRNYIHIIVYQNPSLNPKQNIVYLVKKYYPITQAAIVHNPFGLEMQIQKNDKGIKQIILYRWSANKRNLYPSVFKVFATKKT